jgi:putative ABC transport system permease protein
MIRNYIKSALRFIRENKIFALINTLGLSIALAASFIILLFIINELSFDHCHKNRKYIFRVLNYYTEFKKTDSGTPYILASALKEEFPQVEKSIRTGFIRDFKLKLKDEYISLPWALGTDSEVFDIFTLSLLTGSGQDLLEDQNSIVLSQELAKKFFPGQDPLGSQVTAMFNSEEHVFTVKGVFRDIPENSTFKAQCLVSSKWTLAPVNKAFGVTNADVSYDLDFWNTWVLLSKDCDPQKLEKQFRAFEIKSLGEKPQKNYSLQNLSDVYLGSSKILNSGIQGDRKNIKLFAVIALLITLVAAINYIILSTAVSSRRAKEIGIRKSFGAVNDKIRSQLLGESILLALLVLPAALILMKIGLPYAAKLFQAHLNIIKSNIAAYISVYLVLTILIGIASGVYTSTYLSKLKVIDILRNTVHSGKRKIYFRSALIVIQLVIFCSFVESTFIIRSQYLFALKKNSGFNNKDIVLIDLGRNFQGYSVFINNIKSNPNVIMAAGTMDYLPTENSGMIMMPHFQDKTRKVQVEGFAVDYNFLETMGIQILEGREFSPEFGGDLQGSTVINEEAIRSLGITDPLGKKLGSSNIIGVVRDFNLHSIHSKIPPLMITMTDKYISQVAVHYKEGTLTNILPFIEAEWKKIAPDRPFHYVTIEELINDLYSSEKNLILIISICAIFILLIASMGLFGLTLFVTRSGFREIGIRKAFGSSEQSIIYSLIIKNLRLVLIAAMLSIPVTMIFISRWLNNYAYKVSINWWFFLISFILASLMVVLTVMTNSIKASRINPIEILKNE